MTFGALKTLLESLDEAGLEEHGDDWDSEVAQQLALLEASYRELRARDRELIDYSETSTQAAYVFMYATGRAEFTYLLLRRMRDELGGPLFKPGTLNVCSLGGGPGSELAGLIKYLDDKDAGESVTHIEYTVFDKEPNWESVVEGMRDALETNITVDLHFEELDVEDPGCAADKTLSEYDLVLMSFFISEVCEIHNRADVIKNLNHLLQTMSPRSYLFYNDSDAYSFYSFINQRTSAAGNFEQLCEIQDTVTVRGPDFDGVIDDMIERFEKTPHLNSKALAKLFVRT